jgi:hypothetical protein
VHVEFQKVSVPSGLCAQFLCSKCVKNGGLFFCFVLGDEPIKELYHQKTKNIKVVPPKLTNMNHTILLIGIFKEGPSTSFFSTMNCPT